MTPTVRAMQHQLSRVLWSRLSSTSARGHPRSARSSSSSAPPAAPPLPSLPGCPPHLLSLHFPSASDATLSGGAEGRGGSDGEI